MFHGPLRDHDPVNDVADDWRSAQTNCLVSHMIAPNGMVVGVDSTAGVPGSRLGG